MATYTPDLMRPVIYPRGLTISRSLTVYSGASDVTSTIAGTYALYDATGTSIVTGTVATGAVSVAVPSTLDLGSGSYEVWSITSPFVGTVRVPVYISASLDSRWNLISHGQLIQSNSWLAIGYPAGRSSWEDFCTAATTETLQVLTRQGRWSTEANADLFSASPLTVPTYHRCMEMIYRDAGALNGAPHFAILAEYHAEQNRDWWARATVAWDEDEDGTADTLGATTSGVGFTPSRW